MDKKLQDAIEKLKGAAGSIRSKDDAIDFLVKETNLPSDSIVGKILRSTTCSV